ncbi:DNA mismatch repair endonuclease MutL [Methanolobus sediminis]|uniref:DNA mismatch repair protein MutL n=1 Tax=Methanolobus sediminis TaxID=3072978 RepID=A0AA51UI80_9EURY|nr:DNA mismatch repair endonuclease MutL [Methanolobus sediminis]WMW24006.1 DNA mismatch repair endonuclease MutL [Methanolobus sediminis]
MTEKSCDIKGSRIKLLDESTINKIAAGEVIERPASVVKELIENSIDAHATDVRVEIGGYGTKSIHVIDNGKGMSHTDASMAFKKHATSKINSIEDLDNILTMGFRGEALASIASVARVELVTRQEGEIEGTKVVVDTSGIKNITSTGAAVGTSILVNDLFYSTPARRKYLKSARTELAHIIDVVSRNALSHPDVSFTLVIDGKVNLRSPSSVKMLDSIVHLYGADVARSLVPLEYESDLLIISGYVSKPEFTRSGKDFQVFFINGRPIYSNQLSNAVRLGYYTLLPKGRYPAAFLNFMINPVNVDVNVHPAKREVRLSHEKEIGVMIVAAVEEALAKTSLVPEVQLDKKDVPVQSRFNISGSKPTSSSSGTSSNKSVAYDSVESGKSAEFSVSSAQATSTSSKPLVSSYDYQSVESSRIEETVSQGLNDDLESSSPIIISDEEPVEKVKTTVVKEEKEPYHYPAKDTQRRLKKSERLQQTSVISEGTAELEELKASFNPSEVKVFGQYADLYILTEMDSKLVLIDQHAAHERIMYEQVLRMQDMGWQELITPITLDLSQKEIAIIEDFIPQLEEMGFSISEFGPKSYVVTTVPSIFGKLEDTDVIHDIISDLLSVGRVKEDTERYDLLCSTMACRAAIKSGAVCNTKQMEELIRQLMNCNNPYTCPHGRPTMISFTKDELAKLFKRTG